MNAEEGGRAERKYRGSPIRAEARWQGGDLAVRLYGGTRPHIGSVVLAIPRPSLRNPACLSATSSVLNRPGHQDELPARKVAEWFASRLNTIVVVACGIHYDGLDSRDIEAINRICRELAEDILPELERQTESRPRSGDLFH